MNLKIIYSTAALFYASGLAHADLVLSNTNQLSEGVVEIGVSDWVAVPFITDAFEYDLTQARLNLAQLPDNSIQVQVWDMRTLPLVGPNQSVGSLTYNAGSSTSTNQVYAGTVRLEADTSYYLVVLEPNGGDGIAGAWSQGASLDADIGVPWRFGSDLDGSGSPTPGTLKDYESSSLGVSWSLAALEGRGLFTLEADVVPEPMTISLIGLTGGALIVSNRVRRRFEGGDPDRPL